ncbi:MAG TPA: response regulator [Candidatus Obscuribacterales bacterium]
MSEAQTSILMVEDTLTQAMMLQHMLESNGFTVQHAKDGEDAIRILSQNGKSPDLILTDVNMPGIDGYELCQKLKSEDKWRKIPIVLLASLLEPSDIIKIIESGADNFILKHYEQNYFISRLRGIVESMPFAKDDSAGEKRKVSLAGEDFEVPLQASKMLDMLISAFETAVYQNWKAKESDDDE